jgi:hemerythrin-like domain-containing protein
MPRAIVVLYRQRPARRPAMTQDTLTRTCDTSDMYIPHGMFREAFRTAGDVIGTGRASDQDRVAVITSYYANVLAFLHAHHGAEDAMLWPLLRERAPEQAALLNRMDSQHAAVDEVLLAASRALDAYRAAPTDELGASLVVAIRRLAIELESHLVEEEREILPLAAVTVSQDEWGALPGWAMSHFTGDKVWLVLGLLFEQMTDAQVTTTLQHVPDPVREMWAETGSHEFAALVAVVRG